MRAYEEAEQYISDIPKFAGKHTLAQTRGLLKKAAGNAAYGKVIHIAGTNGKGSVCAYLRSVLLESGCSVGMFTSPHLETMRERICIGDEMISEEDFVRIFEKVKRIVGEGDHPSFFEFLFLMAMAYFAEKAPEYIILETGLGGRLDATNCIEHPAVCAITEIGYDHMQYLGDTIPEIAAEKAGIIKAGTPVAFIDKRPESTQVLAEYAKKAQSRVFMVGKDNILDVNIRNKSIDFSLKTGYYNYISLSLDTIALYQVENASLAVCVLERLGDVRVTPDSIRRGLWAAHWPGRMEEASPGVYLDGAHNEDGIEAFLKTVREDGCKGERFLMFGSMQDKRYGMMIKKLACSGLFGRAAITKIASDRSAAIASLRADFEQYPVICSFHEDAREAYRELVALRKKEDLIYIAGSLYLIGQMKTLLKEMA